VKVCKLVGQIGKFAVPTAKILDKNSIVFDEILDIICEWRVTIQVYQVFSEWEPVEGV